MENYAAPALRVVHTPPLPPSPRSRSRARASIRECENRRATRSGHKHRSRSRSSLRRPKDDSQRASRLHDRRSRSQRRDSSRSRSKRSVRSRARDSGRARERRSRCSSRSSSDHDRHRSRSKGILHYVPRDHDGNQASGHSATQQPNRRASPTPKANTTVKQPPPNASNIENNNILSQLVHALQTVGKDRSVDKLSIQNAIPEFNPARKEQTIAMWLHKVNECAIIYGWTGRQTVHFALPKLKGLAQKWYEGLPSVLYSWDEWQDKLRVAFPSDENYGQLLTMMLAKRARFSDSLEEYFYEKVVLLNRCGIDGKRAVDCIVHGIDDRSVRLGAEAARFNSSDQLLPYLKNVRSSNVVGDRKRTRNNDMKTDGTSKEGTKDRIIKCYNCLQEGHFRSQCPKPRVKCDRCNLYGHTEEKCRVSVVNDPKNAKPVMLIGDGELSSSKYYKQAMLNGEPVDCFIDFGSTATIIKRSIAESSLSGWNVVDNLPMLKGFGNAIVKPLGAVVVDLAIDSASARVKVIVVPDDVMRVPLIIGQTFTEQPHIIVEKDCNQLNFTSTERRRKVKIICSADITVDGLTAVDFQSDSMYTGDVYIEKSSRFQHNKEYYLVQGLFSLVNGCGVALVKGLSANPFILKSGTLIARCDPAKLDELETMDEVFRVESTGPPRPILESDIVTGGNLDKSEVKSLVSLLNKYRTCFAFDLSELGKTDLVKMEIHLKDDEPVVYRPYRLPFSERDKVRTMVSELLENGIIRPSTSNYASPIVLVKKKTGDIRLCVDYRSLNRKTVKENFPLPRIDDQLDDLAGYSFYTTLDLASGYYQIPIRECDRHKTSFVTPDGQFEFTRMPFGLVNAPSTFMRTINLVLSNSGSSGSSDKSDISSGSNKVASAYMDDIIVPSVSLSEGLDKLEVVLQLLEKAQLTLKLSKCCFFSRTVDYLGFELSTEGIKPGTRKIEAVRDFPEPTNQHGVRQFIGLCSFFRRFVKGFAIIAKPLTALLKKDAIWLWSTEQKRAFNTLKEELLSKPILALYNPKAATELHTDACKIGVAGILMQRDRNDALKPVAYYSRQTTAEEQHMTAYELETLAVITSLQKFRVYLMGIEFKVFTDCNSLRATFLKRDLIPRVARWWIAMQEYNFTIEYKPGKAMAHVDALSRNPPPSTSAAAIGSNDTIMSITENDWLSTVQTADTEIQRKISILGDPHSDDVIDIKTNFVVRNGKLYRKTNHGERWVVPKGVRFQILKQCHDDIGHFAFEKTLAKVEATYWFPKMRKFTKKYVESCLECAYAKSTTVKKPPLHPIPKDDTPFETLHIDHVGPFVRSAKGNTHLLVIIDAYTKFIVLKPVKSTKSSIAIDKMREYFSIFGVPKRVVSDRGSCFTSKTFTEYMVQLGVKHVLNAVATPRANGQVERYNRTLLDALTAKCASGVDEKKWDVHVPDVQLGLNNTINKGIGKTPAQALFGINLTGTTEGRVKLHLDNDNIEIREKITDIRDKINEHITEYQEKQKITYDKKTCPPKEYIVGDLVSIEREIQSTGQSRKLVPKFQGPYRVVAVLGNDRYQIEDTPITKKGKRNYSAVVSVDKMKPWLHFNRSSVDSSSSNDGDSDCDRTTE